MKSAFEVMHILQDSPFLNIKLNERCTVTLLVHVLEKLSKLPIIVLEARFTRTNCV